MYKWDNPRPPYPNELYHYGIMGMHWGIRRYQPYRKGEKVKGGHFIGQAIAKNRTTRDSYLSSFLASDYQRKVDKLHEETQRRKSKFEKAVDKNASTRKQLKKMNRYKKALARENDNQARADFWKDQAKADIATAKQVNDAFKKDHPNTFRKAPASSIESGANRWIREHTNPDTAAAAVAPMWNWDRGWGHQWAVEKSKGFDYKKNRDTEKLYRNVDKTAAKALIYRNKAQKEFDKGRVLNTQSYLEKLKAAEKQNKAETEKAFNKAKTKYVKEYNNAKTKQMAVKTKMDALKAKNKTDTQRYADLQREYDRLDILKGNALDSLPHNELKKSKIKFKARK